MKKGFFVEFKLSKDSDFKMFGPFYSLSEADFAINNYYGIVHGIRGGYFYIIYQEKIGRLLLNEK